MDLRDLKKVSQSLAVERQLHPPRTVFLPVRFCFQICKVDWSAVDTTSGRQLTQHVIAGNKGFYGLPCPVDPWHMREEFLGLKTESDMLRFLTKYGRWDDSKDNVPVDSIMDLQVELRELLLSPRQIRLLAYRLGWMNRKFTFSLRWEKNSAIQARIAAKKTTNNATSFCVVECGSITDVLFASVQIDLLDGAKFGTCARPDCQVPFRVTSNHKRKYCSQPCAHLESVRRNRKKKTSRKLRAQGRSWNNIAKVLHVGSKTAKRLATS